MANIKWKPSKEHSRDTVRADAVFNRLINEVGAGDEFNRRYICAHWKQIFDKHIVRHVRLIDLNNKKLFLYCPEPAWADSIKLNQLAFMDRINKFAGSDMVRELVFTSYKEAKHAEINGPYQRPWEQEAKEYAQRIEQTNLSEDALAVIRKRAERIEDEALRNAFIRMEINGKKLKNVRREDGWQKCALCDNLTEPGTRICYACQKGSEAKSMDKLRKILQDEPWSRYKDIKPVLNCTPYMINKQRAVMIQELLPAVDMEDQESMVVAQLVMLYKIIPPEELILHPEYVWETLKHFRYDLGDKFFEYLERHPEKKRSQQKKAREKEYAQSREYKPKNPHVAKKKYEIPEYTPGQQREKLKAREV